MIFKVAVYMFLFSSLGIINRDKVLFIITQLEISLIENLVVVVISQVIKKGTLQNSAK